MTEASAWRWCCCWWGFPAGPSDWAAGSSTGPQGDLITPIHTHTLLLVYSSNLLTPTWPLCKNILSVDYERSISFRKCNRWKSFEIVHVYCLNNKKCYNIQYDYDIGQWRLGPRVSAHCLRSGIRGFQPQQISFSIVILVKPNRPWVEWQGKVKHWVSRAISLISWIISKSFTYMGKLNIRCIRLKQRLIVLKVVGFNYIVLCVFSVFGVHCLSSAVLLNKIKL